MGLTQIIKNYEFDASARTITFSDYDAIRLENVLVIVNKSRNNYIIYSSTNTNRMGSVAGNVLTLTYNTESMSDTDILQIRYVQHQDKTFRSLNLGSKASIKNGPGRITGYFITNQNSTQTLYVKIYDALLADVTLGSGIPKITWALPKGQGANVGGLDIEFEVGITAVATQGVSDADDQVPGSNEIIANIYYNI